MARARKKGKGQKARRLHQEPIVREVARLLETGVPTKWRWTSEARHGLRAALCMKGVAWAAADERSEEIVMLARHRIGLSNFPSWIDAQGPMPQAVEYFFCSGCGGHMEGGNDRPWCSQECYQTVKERWRTEHGRRADEAQRSATRIILTAGAPPPPAPLERACRKCGKLFKPLKPRNRYCGRSCAALRVKYRARECLTCATHFQPHYHKQICCGPECWNKLRLARLRARRVKRSYERSCVICGDPFTAGRSTAVLCGRQECAVMQQARRSKAGRERAQQREAANAEQAPADDAPARVLAKAA